MEKTFLFLSIMQQSGKALSPLHSYKALQLKDDQDIAPACRNFLSGWEERLQTKNMSLKTKKYLNWMWKKNGRIFAFPKKKNKKSLLKKEKEPSGQKRKKHGVLRCEGDL